MSRLMMTAWRLTKEQAGESLGNRCIGILWYLVIDRRPSRVGEIMGLTKSRPCFGFCPYGELMNGGCGVSCMASPI